MQIFLGVMLVLTAAFLILIILVQRGRGGGLAGALGGMGGQSAFGTKAGDTFTKVTFGVVAFWILLCVASLRLMSSSDQVFTGAGTSPSSNTEDVPTGKGDDKGTLPPTKAGDKSGDRSTPSDGTKKQDSDTSN